MKILLFLIAFLACQALAENRNVLIDGGTDTTTIGNNGDRLKVEATGSGTFSVTQSTSPWVTSRNWTLSNGTDSIAAVQSGTWTVQQGSAPWSVSQSGTWTVQQGTPPWSMVGNIASGVSDSGNPVKVGGSFNTTQPTVTNGQRVDAQMTSRGGQIVATGADNFNINNISGTVSLPTGASTSANQTSEITALQIIDDVPTAANGAFVKGDPIMGQFDNVSTTAATEDNLMPVRITAQRALHINLRDVSGAELGNLANPLVVTDGPDISYLAANYIYSASGTLAAATAGVNNPILLFRNPNASGVKIIILRFTVNTNVSNVTIDHKIFASPTVTVNGTTLNSYSRNIGNGAAASVALLTTGPTVSASGNLVEWQSGGQNSNTEQLIDSYDLGLQPNNSFLYAADPSSSNRAVTFTVVWAEVPM